MKHDGKALMLGAILILSSHVGLASSTSPVPVEEREKAAEGETLMSGFSLSPPNIPPSPWNKNYIYVEVQPLIAKCHGLFIDKAPPEEAYQPVIACLKDEVMRQANIMMKKRTLAGGAFEKKMNDHLAARAKLFEAMHQRRSEVEPMMDKRLFIDREITRFLGEVLKVMTRTRNINKIDEKKKEQP